MDCFIFFYSVVAAMTNLWDWGSIAGNMKEIKLRNSAGVSIVEMMSLSVLVTVTNSNVCDLCRNATMSAVKQLITLTHAVPC